ncbi:hypothetical protein BDV12DRAFT_51722 [Aspergillus spectabilis]
MLRFSITSFPAATPTGPFSARLPRSTHLNDFLSSTLFSRQESNSREEGTSTSSGNFGLALGLTAGFLGVLVITLIIMRTKPRPSFDLRSLFSRSSKKDTNAKPAKSSSATPFDNNYTSTPRPFRANAAAPVKKEYQILGVQSDPRKAYPSTQHQQPYSQAPPPSKKSTYTPSKHTLQITRKPKPSAIQTHPQSRNPAPSRRPAPRYAPAPPLRLPLHQLRSPDLERGHPLSPTASLRTFATRSSGVFPHGMEPYAVDDYHDDQVLMLPSPPKAARSYGKYRVMPRP